jgi:glycosyltransferase involved in cell wall biosynthesis
MNILFTSYYNPLGKGGFEKQAMGLMKTLNQQGHHIACLTIATPDNQAQIKKELEATGIFNLGSFVISHQKKGYSFKTKLLFWFSQNPIDLMTHETPELKSQVNSMISQIIEDQQIDVIHCLSLRTCYYLKNYSNFPLVLDLVDSFTSHKKRLLKYYISQLDFAKTKNLFFDFIKTIKIEKNILKSYPNSPVLVVSNLDQKILTNLNKNSLVYCVSHPVTINCQKITIENNQKTSKIITFYGYLEQMWNNDAFLFLVQKIMPMVIKRHPDLKLLVTGINLSQKIFNLEKQFDWIKVIPMVENIEEFASQATLNCWPFRLGSGFKNKIIESMALGKPVITTTIGAEALTESQKKALLIADTAQGLADHIIYLLENPNERIRLGKINYEIATTEFTWERKALDYLQLYQLAQDKFKHKNKTV